MNKKSLMGEVYFPQLVPMYINNFCGDIADMLRMWRTYIYELTFRRISVSFLIKNKNYKYKMLCLETACNSDIFASQFTFLFQIIVVTQQSCGLKIVINSVISLS